MTLPDVGAEGQEKLLAARVLVVGLGGLGSPTSIYLAAAGVGHLGLIDFDTVSASNLQRQILYQTDQIGELKTEMASKRINGLNPDVECIIHDDRLTSKNALKIFSNYDYIVDGTDNFATRYLVNDACVLSGKVNIYGSIFRFEGQSTIFAHPDGPCYRCLFPEPPKPGEVPNCAEGGVLGILPGHIGMIQATETIKSIIGIGDTLVGRLVVFDALKMKWREMRIKKNPKCPACGDNPTIKKLIDYEQFCGIAPGSAKDHFERETPAKIKKMLESGRGDLFLLDVREPYEHEIANIEGATLIPLNELSKRIGEIKPQQDKTIIAYCHHGMRSAKALKILHKHGFKSLINVEGGINAWAHDVDSSLPCY